MKGENRGGSVCRILAEHRVVVEHMTAKKYNQKHGVVDLDALNATYRQTRQGCVMPPLPVPCPGRFMPCIGAFVLASQRTA